MVFILRGIVLGFHSDATVCLGSLHFYNWVYIMTISFYLFSRHIHIIDQQNILWEYILINYRFISCQCLLSFSTILSIFTDLIHACHCRPCSSKMFDMCTTKSFIEKLWAGPALGVHPLASFSVSKSWLQSENHSSSSIIILDPRYTI